MTTWDNIHLWSNKKIKEGYVKKQPSTPGAFHCFHLHWRWPYIASNPTAGEKLLIETVGGAETALGDDQFKGIDLRLNIGQPLLDPKIPDQTIRFAITKSQDPEYEKLKNKSDGINLWDPDTLPPSTEVFEHLFFNPTTKLPVPRDISKGENLLFWISFEVFKPDPTLTKFEGTVFPHGFYFAHNVEPKAKVNPFEGTIGGEIQNPSYQNPTWQRYPNGQ